MIIYTVSDFMRILQFHLLNIAFIIISSKRNDIRSKHVPYFISGYEIDDQYKNDNYYDYHDDIMSETALIIEISELINTPIILLLLF